MKLTKTQANFSLLFTAFVWGTSYTFIKQATNAHMSAGLINALRGVIFVTLLYLAFHKTINKITLPEIRTGIVGGLINFSVVQLQTSGLKYTTPGNSAFITATYVIFVPFFAWIVFHKKPPVKAYFAVVLCVIGMLFLTGIMQNGFNLQFGDLLTIFAAVSFACLIIFYSYTGATVNPLNMTFMIGLTQAIAGAFCSILFERGTYASIDWHHAIIPLVILTITSSFIAQTLQIFSQKFTDPITAGLLLMTESLFASIISVVFGVEHLTHQLIIGGSLIFIALLLTQVDFGHIFGNRKT